MIGASITEGQNTDSKRQQNEQNTMKREIPKSEALPDFIARRFDEVKKEWEQSKVEAEGLKFYLPKERVLYGRFIALKEIVDKMKLDSSFDTPSASFSNWVSHFLNKNCVHRWTRHSGEGENVTMKCSKCGVIG